MAKKQKSIFGGRKNLSGTLRGAIMFPSLEQGIYSALRKNFDFEKESYK